MKTQTNILKIIIVLLILIILLGGFYFYRTNKIEEITPVNNIATTTQKVEIPDSIFIQASEDSESKILAKGDVNNDGYDDAIVTETFCGASCSIDLVLFINNNNTSSTRTQSVGFEGYLSGTAMKSDVSEVKIEDGIISITGKGLDCPFFNCTEEKWNVVKTLKYEFIDNEIVRLPTN